MASSPTSAFRSTRPTGVSFAPPCRYCGGIEEGDAFGRALLDWTEGGTEPEVNEREDGYLEAGAGPELYLAGSGDWPSAERRALRHVRGRALDLGCGAGRVALELQRRGVDVVGADTSSLALRAARARGLRQVRTLSAGDVGPVVARFDTVVLFGNNAGIFGSPAGLQAGLSEWSRRMRPGSRVLAESTAPDGGGAPLLDGPYRRANRRRGLMPGQLRLRVRYGKTASPWFSWLFVSQEELRDLVAGTGWHCRQILADDPEAPFVAVLENRPVT